MKIKQRIVRADGAVKEIEIEVSTIEELNQVQRLLNDAHENGISEPAEPKPAERLSDNPFDEVIDQEIKRATENGFDPLNDDQYKKFIDSLNSLKNDVENLKVEQSDQSKPEKFDRGRQLTIGDDYRTAIHEIYGKPHLYGNRKHLKYSIENSIRGSEYISGRRSPVIQHASKFKSEPRVIYMSKGDIKSKIQSRERKIQEMKDEYRKTGDKLLPGRIERYKLWLMYWNDRLLEF